MSNKDLQIGISIPAYRNVTSLRRALISVATYAPETRNSIVVVDDSGNGVVANQLRDEFPAVRWIVHSENQGFGASATEAVLANAADIVVLLNDDVELLSNLSTALRSAFRDSQLFAATFRSADDQGNFREGAKRLVWRMGWPRVLHNERDQARAVEGVVPSSYAVGGHAAFHRRKFASLGGFDPLYAPFYWEDVDLCARAAQQGWRCVYLAECTVMHAGPSAIRSEHDRDHIREITLRNRLLFAWRHARGRQPALLQMTLLWERLKARLRGDPTFARALRSARDRQLTQSSLSLRAAPTATDGASIER